MLEGFDPEWIEAGTSRLASYTNLPPGDYVFRIQSDDGEGRWASHDTRYTLSLAPRFYQTLWFYVAGVLLLAGLTVVTLPRARPPVACARARAHRRS